MTHKPQNELAEAITTLKDKIQVGRRYCHYKDPSKTYTVRAFVVIESTDSIGVLYQAEYGPRLSFVRPATEWLEEVKGVPRFRKA